MKTSCDFPRGSAARCLRSRPPLTRAAKGRVGPIARAAAAFFRSHGRSFPWRREADPYKLAVAEILLQKTRADSVVGTYLGLISEYPDAESLADADERQLSAVLLPLGLSRKRSAMLIAMAHAVVMHGTGVFSDVNATFLTIPGLGAYAARAIACFATGENVGIVDANVARIIRRVFAIRNKDNRAVIFQRYADAVAASESSAREVNFGLLDIGAALCSSVPRCGECPLIEACAYARRHRKASRSREARA